jgi:urease accessory protein
MTAVFRTAAALATLLVAGPALAHTGVDPHVHGFAMGFAHPLGGADHLLAMLAVGLWAGLVGGTARWAWPVAFLTCMAAGGILGMTGLELPLAEVGIGLSVAVLGLLVAFGVRAPIAAGVSLCGIFALAHGFAHGSEMPADASGLTYGLGFIGATALIHGAGLGLAFLGAMAPRALRIAGAGVALAGVGLLAG